MIAQIDYSKMDMNNRQEILSLNELNNAIRKYQIVGKVMKIDCSNEAKKHLVDCWRNHDMLSCV